MNTTAKYQKILITFISLLLVACVSLLGVFVKQAIDTPNVAQAKQEEELKTQAYEMYGISTMPTVSQEKTSEKIDSLVSAFVKAKVNSATTLSILDTLKSIPDFMETNIADIITTASNLIDEPTIANILGSLKVLDTISAMVNKTNEIFESGITVEQLSNVCYYAIIEEINNMDMAKLIDSLNLETIITNENIDISTLKTSGKFILQTGKTELIEKISAHKDEITQTFETVIEYIKDLNGKCSSGLLKIATVVKDFISTYGGTIETVVTKAIALF